MFKPKKTLLEKIFFTFLLLPFFVLSQRPDPYGTISQWNEYENICRNVTFNNINWEKCSFLGSYLRADWDDYPNNLKFFASEFFRKIAYKYQNYYPNEKFETKCNVIEGGLELGFVSREINFSFKRFDNNIIAIASSPGDSNYEIIIDPVKWNNAHIAEKIWIMWHELAHEFFATKHGQGGGMMFPISAGDKISLNRLWNAWDSMSDWLVENKKREIRALHFKIDDCDFEFSD